MRRPACAKRLRRRIRRRQFLFECLEPRQMLATVLWNVDTDGFWDEAANWLDQSSSQPRVPSSGDDVLIDRGLANPTITIREVGQDYSVNALTSRESIVIAGRSLTINGTAQIDDSTLTLNGGNLSANGTVTIAASGVLDWQAGGIFGNGLNNDGAISISGSADVGLSGTLTNRGIIAHAGSGNLVVTGTLMNQASGEFDFQSDGGITGSNTIINAGMIKKTAGNGVSRIGPSPGSDLNLHNTGGTLDASVGTIHLDNLRGDSTGGTFNASAGATIKLQPRDSARFEGLYTGSGEGRMELAGGVMISTNNGATLTFADDYFHWTDGVLVGVGPGWTSTDAMTLSGTANKRLSGRLTNAGTIHHQGDGNLQIDGSTILTVNPGAIYDFAGDGDIEPSGIGAGFISYLQNDGTFRKSAGTSNTSDVSMPINTTPSSVFEANVGRLKLSGGGLWNSTTINAAVDAAVEIAGTPAFTGTFTGIGAGRVELSAGVNPVDAGVPEATAVLNFPPSLFHWTGGTIHGGGCGSGVGCNIPLTNSGEITLDGPDGKAISRNTLINTGTVINLGPGEFSLNGNIFDNRQGAVYEHRSEATFAGLDQFGNRGQILNAGVFRKPSGNGVVDVTAQLNNASTGVVQVDSGRFRFTRGGTSNGITFDVAAGAGVDLAGDSNNAFFFGNGTYTGSGVGTVVLTGQIQALNSDAPVFDFPPGMFRWRGGSIFWRLINNGEITLDAPDGVFSRIHFTNNGTFIHSGAGDYLLNPDSIFENKGLYEIRSDADIVVPNSGSAGTMQFANTGILRKASGIGTSELRLDANHPCGCQDLQLNNSGTVEVMSGTLAIHRPIAQVKNSTLIDGTWHVGPFATLDFVSTDNITINQADVILEGAASRFARFNTLDDNRGTFELLGGRDFTTAGNLTNSGELVMGPGSILTVSGNYTETESQSAVAWYRGENNAQDSIGTNHGTLQGTVPFAAGQFGESFSLDGERDFVSVGNPAALRLQDFTISAWVKRDDVTKGGGIFLYGQSGYGFGIQPSGALFLTQIGINHVETSNVRVTDTGFHHLAVSKSGGIVTFYVDGVAETVVGYSPTFNFFTNAAIGARADSSDPAFVGRIDEVAIFNRPLDQTKVVRLMNSNDVVGVGGNRPRVIAEISGRPRSGEFGQLRVNGVATPRGPLDIDVVGGYGPTPDDAYRIVSYSSRTGDFSAVNGLDPFFTAAVNPTNITLNVKTNVPTFDLDVTNIAVPVAGAPGDLATIMYTVANLSSNAAGGTWIDSVYLSSDITFSSDDILIGRIEHVGGVPANGNYTETLVAPLPGVVDGEYHVIVLADSRNQLPDTDRSNNREASTNRIAVSTPALTFGVTSQDTIANGQDKFYRLDVPAGGDVKLSASFAVPNQAEFFVAYRRLPTRSDFEFVANDPTELMRQITLASPQAGSYFVLVHGREGAAAGQSFSLRPERVEHALDSVSPNRGANIGNLTTTVTGSGFTPVSVVELLNSAGQVVREGQVQFADPNTLFATFALNGLGVEKYGVRVTTDGQSQSLSNAITVISGRAGSIETRLAAPSSLRAGRVYTAVLEYFNVGDTDVLAPLIFLTANGAELRPEGSRDFIGSHTQILGINKSGPAGILPPGARGRMDIAFIPSNSVLFDLHTLIDPSLQLNWDQIKVDLRPEVAEQEAWDVVFANLRSVVGNTAGEVQAVLADNATYLSKLGIYTGDVLRLLNFELQQADDMGEIFARYSLGRFGRGMSDPFGTRSVLHADKNVTIVYGAQARGFERQPDGSYRGGPEDLATVTESNGIVRLRELSGTVLQFGIDGTLSFVEAPGGRRSTFNYVDHRLMSVVDSATNLSHTYEYNDHGRVSKETTSTGFVITYDYDAAGEHVIRISNADGTREFSYITGQGAAREHAIQSVTYDDGTHYFFEYDDRGRLIRTVGDIDAAALTFSYDSAGGTTITDSANNQGTVFLNDREQAGASRDSFGNFTVAAFNSSSKNMLLNRGLNGASVAEYDERGNPTRLVDPLGQEYRFDFNKSFNSIETLRDPRGNTMRYTYDGSGHVTIVTYADDSSQTFAYDAAGNMTRTVNARSQAVEYDYNANGQLIRRRYPDGSQVEYTYDIRRNLILSATETDGTTTRVTTFQYNEQDQLIRVDYPTGRSVEFAYDAGHRTMVRDQQGFEVRYEYNDLQQLTALTDANGTPFVTYSYDSLGRLTRETKANGTSTEYMVDDADQLRSLIHRDANGEESARFDYEYDARGRVTSVVGPLGMFTYAYDATDQLIQVTMPNGQINYSYDAAGNRTSFVDHGANTNYATNNLNQYTSIQTSQGTTTFGYDADGNLTSRTDANGATTTYTYDAEGRMTQIATSTDVWQFEYDVLGNRTATIHNGDRTEYLIDPLDLGNVIAEYDDTGSLVARYVNGAGLVARVDAADMAAFYNFDANGSAVALTGNAGAILNSYSFLPYGEVLQKSESVSNPFTFVGQFGVMGDVPDAYFMRNRWYDPQLGRFMRRDPIGLSAGDANLYRYVENNPVYRLDPSGTNSPLGLSLDEAIEVVAQSRGAIQAGLSPTLQASAETVQLAMRTVLKAGEGASFIAAERAKEYTRGHLLAQHVRELEQAAQRAANAIPRPAPPVRPPTVPVPPSTAAIEAGGESLLTQGVKGLRNALRPSNLIRGFFSKANLLTLTVTAGFESETERRINEEAEKHRQDVINGQTQNRIVRDNADRLRDCFEIYASNPELLGRFCKQLLVASGLLHSQDPNEIIGPVEFILPDQTLPYTIHFENLASASAPAVEVFVTQQLDSNLDWSTFELGSFGFGGQIIEVPPGRNSYSTQLLLPGSPETGGDDLLVEITAGIDLDTGRVSWTFRALDPATGDLPVNALAGFLPPNDANGIGQGFVAYTVRSKNGLTTGTPIDAQATIIFDTEPSLDTNASSSTIDAAPPTSGVLPLPPSVNDRFRVRWNGADDGGGSGLAQYEVFVSDDDGPWTLFMATTLTEAFFVGQPGHTYGFFSVATDNVGHRQQVPVTPDAVTTVSLNQWQNAIERLNVNDDEDVSPIDALLGIIELNFRFVSDPLTGVLRQRLPSDRLFLDVNGDGLVSPIDILLVINRLNGVGGGEAAGEARLADKSALASSDLSNAVPMPPLVRDDVQFAGMVRTPMRDEDQWRRISLTPYLPIPREPSSNTLQTAFERRSRAVRQSLSSRDEVFAWLGDGHGLLDWPPSTVS